MAIELKRIPVFTTITDLGAGEVVVYAADDQVDIGIIVLLSPDRPYVLTLASLAGTPKPGQDPPRLQNPDHGSFRKFLDPVIARPVAGSVVALEGDPCPGALVSTPGGAFVRVEMNDQVAYFNLRTGERGDPGTPRVFYPRWALAFEDDSGRIICSVGSPKAVE